MSQRKAPVIQAAGGVLWREKSPVRGGAPEREVAMVHRPRYDDWSLPKGKRKPSEELLLTGVREVTEETGHQVEVGPYLGQYSYEVTSSGRQAVKTVKYWSMRDAGGDFERNDEVDELAWMDPSEAAERTRFPTDRKVLEAFAELPDRTSVLLVVRNGSAVRASRHVAPHKRSLDRRGRDQAAALVPILSTLAVDRLVSTPPRRCVDTLGPYAAQRELKVDVDESLSATAGTGARVATASGRLLELVTSGDRVAVCAEGVVVDRLVAAMAAERAQGAPGRAMARTGAKSSVRSAAAQSQRVAIKKGSWCLIHVGAGRLLSIERPEET